jgi:hypothetical protein
MNKDELRKQVISVASQGGASQERAKNYGDRAVEAFVQLMKVANVFVKGFNDGSVLSLAVDESAACELVLKYHRSLIALKCWHSMPADDRVDTHICAGLWCCAICQSPIFAFDEDDGDLWDAADQEQLDRYYRIVAHFAFYFAFRVLRGHYSNYKEFDLLRLLAPLRDYFWKHSYDLSKSEAAMVGIFYTISLFDHNFGANQ